jgi:hypothetical protein
LKLLHRERTGGMTTNLQTQPEDIDDLEILDRLIHDIQNNLQVIRMEAELSVMEQAAKPQGRCAFTAAENIEKLVEEVKKWFVIS